MRVLLLNHDFRFRACDIRLRGCYLRLRGRYLRLRDRDIWLRDHNIRHGDRNIWQRVSPFSPRRRHFLARISGFGNVL